MAIYSVHFLVRFTPEIHATPFLPREEKIARNMYDRELGELIKNAREKIPPHSPVLLDSGGGDYINRIICFYLIPRPCAYKSAPATDAVYYAPCVYPTMSPCAFELPSGPDAVIGYYSHSARLPGFNDVFTINPDVYVALRQ